MTRYKQTHERFACTEPVSHRFEVAEDDAEPNIVRIPDITLATDRPVPQWVMGKGMVRLRLRLQKRASIPAWKKNGRVQPDGSLTMLGDHGSGSFWEPNSARDNIGRWHNLRVDTRGEGDDEHLALVADAHIHTDLAANWLSRGGSFRPESVASVFRSGTIRDTSVGFEFDHNTLKLEDEERQIYRTDEWRPHEASFVWEGADDTGIGRAEDDSMSKELLEELLEGQKSIAAEQTALGVRLTLIETPEPQPAPAPAPETAVTDEQKRWDATVALAKKDSGDTLDATIEVLALDPSTRSDKLSAILLGARTENRPPNPARGATGGIPNHFELMNDAQVSMLARNPVTADIVKDRIDKVPKTLRTAPLHTFLELELRHSGLVDSHFTSRGPEDVFKKFKRLHRAPESAIRSDELGGMWLALDGARFDHNGELDIEDSLRSAPGTAVPADFPALLVSIATQSFDGSYQSAGIDVDQWSRRMDMDTLDPRDVIRADVAVPSFKKLALPGKDLEAATRWHDKLNFQVQPRGFVYSWSNQLMLRDHGNFLVDTPVLLADGWNGERDQFVVNIVIDHAYVGDFDRNEAIFDFLTNVFKTAFQQVIVERPDSSDIKLNLRKNRGQLLPTKLVYGPCLETEMSNFFKGRLTPTGRLPADTISEDALTDWMTAIGRSREMSPIIPATSREMYLTVAGGIWSSIIHGSLRGLSGPRVKITDDINWKRWDETGMRVTEVFGAKEWQPNTMYRNTVPA